MPPRGLCKDTFFNISIVVVIVELKDQADSILVIILKEAFYMQLQVTVGTSALIISQDMLSNKMLFHSLVVTLLSYLCLGRSALCGAYCTGPLM